MSAVDRRQVSPVVLTVLLGLWHGAVTVVLQVASVPAIVVAPAGIAHYLRVKFIVKLSTLLLGKVLTHFAG